MQHLSPRMQLGELIEVIKKLYIVCIYIVTIFVVHGYTGLFASPVLNLKEIQTELRSVLFELFFYFARAKREEARFNPSASK